MKCKQMVHADRHAHDWEMVWTERVGIKHQIEIMDPLFLGTMLHEATKKHRCLWQCTRWLHCVILFHAFMQPRFLRKLPQHFVMKPKQQPSLPSAITFFHTAGESFSGVHP